MKKLIYSATLLLSSLAFSQVGINTQTPKTTLDVVGKPTETTELDGIIAPRITGEQLRAKTYTTEQTGALVYVTAADSSPAGQTVNVTAPGYYYFDREVWQSFKGEGSGGTEDTSIYKNNGTLASDRTVNLNGNKLVFTGDGNFGIGTESPNSKLNVRGGTLNVGNLSVYAGGLQVQNQDASKPVFLAYGTDNVEKMRIANNGNVGIGTTSPFSKLNVRGGILNIGGIAEYAGGLQVQNQDASKPVFIAYGTDNVEKMRIANNGNVGIGTTSPTQKLDIAGSARLRSVESSANTSDITLVVDNNGVIKKKRSEVEGAFISYLFEDRYYYGDSNTTIYRLDRHTQVSDPGDNFNHETGIFVAPATGLYRISMTITIETQSDHNVRNVVVGLATNGNWVIRFSILKDNLMTPGENIGTAFTFTGVGRLTQGTSYYFGTTGQTRFIAYPRGATGEGIGSYFEVERIQ